MFTVGLIHDIGHLLALQDNIGRPHSIAKTVNSGEHTAETMSHITLGESLARAWALPECIIQALRWHHPEQCPTLL